MQMTVPAYKKTSEDVLYNDYYTEEKQNKVESVTTLLENGTTIPIYLRQEEDGLGLHKLTALTVKLSTINDQLHWLQ